MGAVVVSLLLKHLFPLPVQAPRMFKRGDGVECPNQGVGVGEREPLGTFRRLQGFTLLFT